MDFLNEIKTLEERNLILSDITSIKRKDFDSVRKDYLEVLKNTDLNDLVKKLDSFEVIKIIIAIEPTIGILETISSFIKKNTNKRILIDFEIQKEIIGGLQIIYKGKYYDVSVLSLINKETSDV